MSWEAIFSAEAPVRGEPSEFAAAGASFEELAATIRAIVDELAPVATVGSADGHLNREPGWLLTRCLGDAGDSMCLLPPAAAGAASVMAEHHDRLATLHAEADDALARARSAWSRLGELRERRRTLEADVGDLAGQIAEATDELDTMSLENRHASARASLDDVADEIASLERTLEAIGTGPGSEWQLLRDAEDARNRSTSDALHAIDHGQLDEADHSASPGGFVPRLVRSLVTRLVTGAGSGPSTSFSDQVYGRAPQEIDLVLAQLAKDSYARRSSLPEGWERLDAAGLEAAGIDPASLQHDGSGFTATIYRDEDGRHVLAFSGSDETRDWTLSNIPQAAGLSGWQYGQALEVAKDARAAFGDELVVTGHSLGGGLASHAALGAGIPAVTFNAAGLHDNTMRGAGVDPRTGRQVAEDGLIRRYTVESDSLTFYQEDNLWTRGVAPNAVGHRIVLQDPEPLPGWFRGRTAHRNQMHDIPTVIEALERDQPWNTGVAPSNSAGRGGSGGGGSAW